MTHRTLYDHWIHDIQVVIIGYRCFPRIFLVENWLSIFFKNNNTHSEKNAANNYMLKVNKRLTRTKCELFSNLANKKNIRTMSLTSFEYLYCWPWTHPTPCPTVSITDFDFSWTKYQTRKKMLLLPKNVNCFCQFLIKFLSFRPNYYKFLRNVGCMKEVQGNADITKIWYN